MEGQFSENDMQIIIICLKMCIRWWKAGRGFVRDSGTYWLCVHNTNIMSLQNLSICTRMTFMLLSLSYLGQCFPCHCDHGLQPIKENGIIFYEQGWKWSNLFFFFWGKCCSRATTRVLGWYVRNNSQKFKIGANGWQNCRPLFVNICFPSGIKTHLGFCD